MNKKNKKKNNIINKSIIFIMKIEKNEKFIKVKETNKEFTR